ncbi:MAG: hypothetical protein Q8P15_01225 [Nanoarchaeota archaeon]|nr:hypothetical protein [Nanoarchaeota archaeon]
MRKISSKYEEGKKRKRDGWIIGIVLIGVMIFSVLGYAFGGNTSSTFEKMNYNGFVFVKQNDFWVLQKDNFQLIFRYNPLQTGQIDFVGDSINNYLGKPLYISSEYEEPISEIYTNLFSQNKIVQRIQYACLEGERCEEGLPIKTCEDNFIIINEGQIRKITKEKNCVFIEGNINDLTKLSDGFLFKVFGVT